MGLINLMSDGQSYRKIHVDEIRVNRFNFYHDEEDEDYYVESMAKILKKDGMDANGVVYAEKLDDGKSYTLLAGERRFKATKKNFDDGTGDGLFYAKVIKKPENETDEILRIISANNQRNKSKELRKKEVAALQRCWDTLVAEGKKPEGRKRDWMAEKIGLSPRMIQNYLKEETEQTVKEEKAKVPAEIEMKSKFKDISKRAKELYNVRINITKDSIKLPYDDIEELRELLKTLDMEDLINF